MGPKELSSWRAHRDKADTMTFQTAATKFTITFCQDRTSTILENRP